MGCGLSTRPSMHQHMKLENGYLKGGYTGSRRSTGYRDHVPNPGRVNNHIRKSFGGHWNVNEENSVFIKAGIIQSTEISSINVDGNTGHVSTNTAGEDDTAVADRWPKWLTDNIPRQVLRNIVPKSADSYIKIDKIGHGTYSNVYKARDKDTGKLVALKKVRFDTSEPESVKFMAREIMILQKLDHPNIVKLEGLATSRMEYSLYLVFEYMYSDLAKILSRTNESETVTEPQIKCYMQQLLSGLEHCHERGILHRDIKGANLLIDRNGMLKIADLGLGTFVNTERNRQPLTNRVVTLWYRAPELLLGSSDYDVGIDLWSVGCLLAEMFAGRPILPGRTEVEQMHRIVKLCGTPPDDYYKRLKLSTALKPPQTYKSNLLEACRNFPSSSLGLLSTLLALEPALRGSASSALQDEFFKTSPLACDLSGLPVIHVEDDVEAPINDKRKHRTSRIKRKERRKKNIATKKESKEDLQKNAETTRNTFPPEKQESSRSPSHLIFPSPVDPIHDPISSRTDAHPNATRNIKNRPSLPASSRRTAVQRSASSRELRNLDKRNLIA